MIPTVRVVFVGNSGSGKSTGASRLYLRHFPRRIIIDQMDEWHGHTDAYVETLPELVAAIQRLAPKKKWSVAYTVSDNRFPDLVRWLIPVPNVEASPVLAVGGMVLLFDEADLVAHQHNTSEEIRTLFRRSRHTGLSILATSTRPGNISREVSAQATHIVAYRLHEPRDRNYVADVMRWGPSEAARWLAWTEKHPHGSAWKDLATGRVLWLADSESIPSEQAPQSPQPERQRQQSQPPVESE